MEEIEVEGKNGGGRREKLEVEGEKVEVEEEKNESSGKKNWT